MDTIAKSDFFFFISSVYYILWIIFLIITMCYIIPIFKDIRAIVKKAKQTSESALNKVEKVSDDMSSEARAVVRGVGRVINSILPKEKEDK